MDKLIENHKVFLERISLYKKFGYDIEAERSFIFQKAQPISGKIIEVGTGKGYFTIQLAKEGYRFVSIDISAEEQEYAKLNLQHLQLEDSVEFKIENAECLTFKEKTFDIAFSINTAHHLSNLDKVIDEMVRVLTTRGKIILSDFTEDGFKLIAKIHKSEGRKHDFSEDNLTRAAGYLKSRGFEVDRYCTKYQEILIANRQKYLGNLEPIYGS